MATSKHIALPPHDLEQVASFYKGMFRMAEAGRGGSTHISRSDGDLHVIIRTCKKCGASAVGAHGEGCSGMHHITCPLDNMLVCADRLEQAEASELTPLDAVGSRARLAEASVPALRRSSCAVPTASSSTSPGAAAWGMLGRPRTMAGCLRQGSPGGVS
jgi:hypothetical protein